MECVECGDAADREEDAGVVCGRIDRPCVASVMEPNCGEKRTANATPSRPTLRYRISAIAMSVHLKPYSLYCSQPPVKGYLRLAALSIV